MSDGIWAGLSGSSGALVRLDVVANNLANVNTPGYKEDTIAFSSYLKKESQLVVDSEGRYKIQMRDRAYPSPGEQKTQFGQGHLKKTGNPLHMALIGDGMFVIDTPQGELYTRNGSFTMNSEGFLVTMNGHPVMGENGKIKLGEGEIIIDEKGGIFRRTSRMDEEKVSQLKLVEFPDKSRLMKMGNSCFASSDDKVQPEPAQPKVYQGNLELSNVNPVTSMIDLIKINRSHAVIQKAISTFKELDSKVIGTGK